jgi:hypothetical protein
MPTDRPQPLIQVRVIGHRDQADELLTYLADYVHGMFGTHANYRTQTRSARRIGHVRAYLTITRKERSAHDPHDG